MTRFAVAVVNVDDRALHEQPVLEAVGEGSPRRQGRVPVVVVAVGGQPVVGVVGVAHAARQRRDGRAERLAVADGIVSVTFRSVVTARIARNCLRLQVIIFRRHSDTRPSQSARRTGHLLCSCSRGHSEPEPPANRKRWLS